MTPHLLVQTIVVLVVGASCAVLFWSEGMERARQREQYRSTAPSDRGYGVRSPPLPQPPLPRELSEVKQAYDAIRQGVHLPEKEEELGLRLAGELRAVLGRPDGLRALLDYAFRR